MKTIKEINQALKQQENVLNLFTFIKPFNRIIKSKLADYDNKENFFLDLQKGGCVSGMIGEFIYHNDCMKFYTKHIHDLEEFKTRLEDEIGPIKNKDNQPHYTFMCWLCFEEYVYNIYNDLYQ